MNILMIVIICALVLILLYFMMIMPRMIRRPDTSPFRKCLYAHRGLHDNNSDAPENSMKAFERAVREGYGIEMDVQLTKDRVPVVFHDFTLERVCGVKGKIPDYTWEELRQFSLCGSDQRIPKFEEALKLVDARVPLIVELKVEGMDTSVCVEADRLLSDYKGCYCIESFHPAAVFWYRRHRRDVVRGQLSDVFRKDGNYKGLPYFLAENLMLNWLAKPDFVAYNHIYPGGLSRRLCRGLYHNMAVAWTIKSQDELEAAEKHFDVFIFESFLPKK